VENFLGDDAQYLKLSFKAEFNFFPPETLLSVTGSSMLGLLFSHL
jgi:hypothetical protein